MQALESNTQLLRKPTQNEDLLPVEEGKRTWGTWNFIALCVCLRIPGYTRADVWQPAAGSRTVSTSIRMCFYLHLLVIPADSGRSWMIASSMVQLGLSWWQAWISVWIGYGVVAPFIVANARPGAIFHVTFPVVARTSFGVWGSLWCVFNRGAMAWYASLLSSRI